MDTLVDVQLSRPRVVALRHVAAPVLAKDWSEVQARIRAKGSALSRHLKTARAGRFSASYDAGGISRLNAQWGISSGNANRDLRWNLVNLRARSRDLERNDPYFKRFLELVETNVVGHNGIAFQSRAGDYGPGPDYKFTQDKAANSIIEREYAAFSRTGAYEVTGKLSRAAYERLMIRTLARDGEVLEKIVSDPLSRWGVKYQLLEADWLDEKLNEDLPNGNRIVMGVELDPAGKPVAYHLHKNHPGDSLRFPASAERVRYPADRVKHYFIPERPEQVRGVPWAHAAMSRLYQLGEFDDAAILAARLGADKFMVLEDEEGMAADMADGTLPMADSSEVSINTGSGALYFKSQKGSIDILPKGTKLADWNPNYPSDTYGPFVLAALRGISTGFGVSYESLSNDRQGVTWTSIRHAVLDEREHWKDLQRWFIETRTWDAYTAWLDAALLSPFKPLNYLPPGKRDKFLSPVFNGRRWDWVNPKDDIEAKARAIELKLTSHRRVLADQGIDFEELLAEIQDDAALAKTYGVSLAPAPKPAAMPDTSEDDTAAAPAKPKPTRRKPKEPTQ